MRVNTEALRKVEASAILFDQEVAGLNRDLVANVSYSMEKYSRATLLVVTKAIRKVPLLFADTGLEFLETYANIEEASLHYVLELIRSYGTTTFRETFERQGPPAINARWCCKVCKLTPLGNLIQANWGQSLSDIGQRCYKSDSQAHSERIWCNKNGMAHLLAAPIHNRIALLVWLYLMQAKPPHNMLYEHRLNWIGWFMCPSSDMALFHIINEEYPDLWKGSLVKLEGYLAAYGLPIEWITEGKWRLVEGTAYDEDSHY